MKDFFKQYVPYYKHYKLKFFYTIIGMILVALGSSGSAYIIRPLLNQIFINKSQTMLAVLPFFVIVLYFAKSFGGFIESYFISFIGQDIIRQVRNKLLAHILTLDLDFFYKKASGELISRITNDINRIQNAISSQVASFLRDLLTIVGLVAVVIYQSPTLAFYGLIVMPLAIYPLSRLARKMKKLSFRSQESISDITAHLSETFSNIELIKAHSGQKLESEKFAKNNKNFFLINIKAVKINELVSPIMEMLGAVAVAVVIYFGGHKVIHGDLSVGAFFSFITALFMLYTPIKRTSSLYNKMQDALAANTRINDLLKEQAHIKDGEIDFKEEIKQIEFKNVCLDYGQENALKNINLKANLGEKIALVGDSGGGKSSLVNLLMRFYDVKSGEILLNNTKLNDIKIQDLRKQISIVTQRVYIFNDSVLQNVAYGETLDKQKAINALKQAHAFDFIDKLPKGIDTILDESGANLSGGQRQRIAIARALYKNPKILILDEATSALDNESESIISQLIDEVSKEKIIFVIAHRLSTVKNADRIAVFKAGEIVGLGNEQSLLKTCEEFKRLHSLANI